MSEDLTKATARPWRAEGPDEFGDFNILHDGDALAVGAVVSNMRPVEEVAANAATIVAAVNGYDAAKEMEVASREFLVATEALCDWVNGIDLVADWADAFPDDYRRLNSAMTRLRAALSDRAP